MLYENAHADDSGFIHRGSNRPVKERREGGGETISKLNVYLEPFDTLLKYQQVYAQMYANTWPELHLHRRLMIDIRTVTPVMNLLCPPL